MSSVHEINIIKNGLINTALHYKLLKYNRGWRRDILRTQKMMGHEKYEIGTGDSLTDAL
jgi:hypothetical protein